LWRASFGALRQMGFTIMVNVLGAITSQSKSLTNEKKSGVNKPPSYHHKYWFVEILSSSSFSSYTSKLYKNIKISL